MFTRGSKIFFTLACASFFAAVAYGVVTNGLAGGGVIKVLSGGGAVDAVLGPLTFGYKGGVGDHLGYTLLMSMAVCSFGMAFAALAFRDGDPEAVAEISNLAAAPPISEPNDLSPWPIAGGFGLMLVALGLAASPYIFVAGCALLVIVAAEWTVKAWSERATGDPEVNRIIRNRLMFPIELPVVGLVAIAIFTLSFSRVFLWASEEGAVAIAALIGIVATVIVVAIATRPAIHRGTVVGAVIIGALLVVALGIWGATKGPREFEPHEAASALVRSSVPSGTSVGDITES